jgi:hypothetical protein
MLIAFLMLISVMDTSQAADVALFYNNTYVDTTDEAADVLATLNLQGHTVNTFTGITATDFNNAVAGMDVLVIPELETADLNSAMDSTARASIANFISNGGIFIGFGSATQRFINLANAVFSFSLSAGSTVNPYALNIAGAAGTPFAGGPVSLPYISDTTDMNSASLPSSTKIIYNNGTNVSVFMAPYGNGWVVFLGWDWFNAVPNGSEDGGWLSVLNAAVTLRPQRTTTAVPSMNEQGMLFFFVLAGICAALYMRRQRKTNSL